MKILTLFFIFALSFSFSGVEENKLDKLNLEKLIECSEMEFSDSCNLNIWKITLRPGGDWECETGQNYPCLPCLEELEEDEG